MKDNTKHFIAKGTLYFLLQKYALITDDQTLSLATYKATVSEYQVRHNELHHSGWVANQGGNGWIPNFDLSDLLLFMLFTLCLISNLLRT